jgi:hypothetical protein
MSLACSASAAAAAAVCSTSAALCCVVASISLTALLICSRPAACSCEARVISPMVSATRRAAAMISSRVRPEVSTSREPSCTLVTESRISDLISLAAEADRCARLRTSAATTAKPRPCSPARAASTAALSARRLV